MEKGICLTIGCFVALLGVVLITFGADKIGSDDENPGRGMGMFSVGISLLVGAAAMIVLCFALY